MVKNAISNQDQDHQKGKDTREVSHAVKSPFDYDSEKCSKQWRSQERKRYKRSWSCSVKSPFGYGAEKHCKQLRSRSPERKRYKRSQSHPVKSTINLENQSTTMRYDLPPYSKMCSIMLH